MVLSNFLLVTFTQATLFLLITVCQKTFLRHRPIMKIFLKYDSYISAVYYLQILRCLKITWYLPILHVKEWNQKYLRSY